MLGSGSNGNSALVSTNHCRILIDGGLSARQIIVRLEQCNLTPERLDGVLLTHEHGDHVFGLEVLCRKFPVPIYCNAQTAEASRAAGLVQTFTVPHDAVDPVGYAFHAANRGLGYITDLGYATKMLIERLREVHTLVIETNHDEKLLQSDPARPWPVKQRIMSRHGHLSNASAAGVIEQLLPGKVERVILGHLSRECNTPELAEGAVRTSIERNGRADLEIYCAGQNAISPRFQIGETPGGHFQPTFDSAFFNTTRAA